MLVCVFVKELVIVIVDELIVSFDSVNVWVVVELIFDI